jgi:predicted phosphoribosyltransferase
MELEGYVGLSDLLILALPRGGVPVAYEVARATGAPLDVFVVRRLGVPGAEELAMGAITSGGVKVVNRSVVAALGIAEIMFAEVAERARPDLEGREAFYRDGHPAREVRGKTVLLIDDGLASGSTMRAAAEALRRRGSAKVVAAVPVGAAQTCADFKEVADETVCARTPEPFRGVSQWYDDFTQTSDEEVRRLLLDARAWSDQGRASQATAT